MSLSSAPKRLVSTGFTMIGVTEAVCPYCAHRLEKMPGRKKTCPSCGNSIFVRTRPQDKARILVREDELLTVEEQWAIANGTHEQFLAGQQRIEDAANTLRARFGHEPSKNDIQWAMLNDDILTFAQKLDWGLYRNTRFAMAELLSTEKKWPAALDSLLEVCYLDLNGPNNCGGIRDREILRQFPPFDPKMGDLAPGVIGRIQRVVECLGRSTAEVEAQFVDIAGRVEKALNLPLPPNKAWPKLKRALSAD